jgi:hypothetical protein
MAQLRAPFILAILVLAASTATAQTRPRPSVPPQDAGSCPLTHPIEGNFTTYSEEQCFYHMQGWEFFGKTKLERCYATETDAVRHGCRPLEQASLKRRAR